MQRITNNTSASACASCKHQRKKCTEKCVLAPFFPVEKTRDFQAVHRVFGVSNVTKIIVNLNEQDRRRAVESLVWEAVCRQKDPILGPYGEYRRVCEELRLYKIHYQQILQLHTQGNLVYKSATTQGIMGWNNNITNNNIVHTNGNSVVDLCTFGYSSHQIIQERDNGSALILPNQQNLANSFNQQYFLTGPFNPMDSKSVESTLWEGSS
ncbi:hypothetical protein ACJIZ3_007338 [Penstemon smallii]|uniref:LOB domain-containing protein n=1 Tax=Penstemon smallii TaxID=265156 RepID=A0ABD3SAI4_9LAMI